MPEGLVLGCHDPGEIADSGACSFDYRGSSPLRRMGDNGSAICRPAWVRGHLARMDNRGTPTCCGRLTGFLSAGGRQTSAHPGSIARVKCSCTASAPANSLKRE